MLHVMVGQCSSVMLCRRAIWIRTHGLARESWACTRSCFAVAARAVPRVQQLRHERQQDLQGVKLDGLPGDDVFDPAHEMPSFDIGTGVKLDHKSPVYGQGTRLVIWVWHRPSS